MLQVDVKKFDLLDGYTWLESLVSTGKQLLSSLHDIEVEGGVGINLEIPVLVRSLKSNNVDLG